MIRPSSQAAALLAFIIGALLGVPAEAMFRHVPSERQRLILRAAAKMRDRHGSKAAAHWLTLATQMVAAIGDDIIAGDVPSDDPPK